MSEKSEAENVADAARELIHRHYALLEAWEEIRAVGERVPFAKVPILGNVLRALVRLAYLGNLADKQLVLNQISLEGNEVLSHFLNQGDEHAARQYNAIERALTEHANAPVPDPAADLRAPLHDALVQLQNAQLQNQRDQIKILAIEASLGRMHERLEAIKVEYGEIARVLDSRINHQSELQGQAAQAQSDQSLRLVELSNRLSAAQSTLDSSLRLNNSHLQLLEQRIGVAQQATARPLTGDHLIALFRMLEQAQPELAQANHVALSIQDGSAEDLILLGVEYFGARLDSVGWKTTNDAWYHVDFTAQWNRALLFENAASKLKPGGFFALITDSGNAVHRFEDVGLLPVRDHVFTLSPGMKVGTYLWQRSAREDGGKATA